jgi:hypothetical protein
MGRRIDSGAGSALEIMRALRVACGVFALACVVFAQACTGIEPCKKRGIAEACKCDGGSMGTRSCLPELVWDHCECGNLPAPDAGTSGSSGNGSGGAGAMSGGTSGSSGRTASAGTGGSSGASGSTAPNPDDDAGIEPMAGAGGAGNSGSGGIGGISGSGGTGGTQSTGSPYKACAMAMDCGSGASCESAPDPDDALAMVHACAPACSDAAACPKPDGSFDATLVCDSGHCRLDCSGPLLEPDLSCPTGMRCVTSDLLGPSYCF